MQAETIVIRAKYPRALPAAELHEMKAELEKQFPDIPIKLDDSRDENRVAVSLAEIVHVVVAGAAVAALPRVLDVIQSVGTEWMKKRFVNKPTNTRKKIVVIYDDQGRPLREVEVDGPVDDPKVTKREP